MIIGIGVDIVEIARIARVVKRKPRFVMRILTERERAHLPTEESRRIEYIAGRFAAKEAIAKALGVGIGAHLGWQSLSIVRDPRGKPTVLLDDARKSMEEWQHRHIHLSIAHERSHAIAFVTIEQRSFA